VSAVTQPAEGMWPDVAGLASRTREFVRAEVLPAEDEFDGDVTAAAGDDLRRRLQEGCSPDALSWHPTHRLSSAASDLSMSQRPGSYQARSSSVQQQVSNQGIVPVPAPRSPPGRSPRSRCLRDWLAPMAPLRVVLFPVRARSVGSKQDASVPSAGRPSVGNPQMFVSCNFQSPSAAVAVRPARRPTAVVSLSQLAAAAVIGMPDELWASALSR
jgi:hypothetical protein